MTALTKYTRLEASGLWRPTPGDQRREVIVSVGDATLTISSLNETALAHWSLAAVERRGTLSNPAIFYPFGDAGETLELNADAAEMIEAIETLRKAVHRARPKPGRLRWLGATLSISAVAALMIFWLPGALINHALNVVPEVTRTDIGSAVLSRIARVAGPPCETVPGTRALRTLAARTGARDVVILRGAVATSNTLPGGTVVLNRSLVEDFEEPDVAAGYILAEGLHQGAVSPLRDLLKAGGLRASITLLTTGGLPDAILDRYAETLVLNPRPDPDRQALLQRFEEAQIRSTPYAYARDISGEMTLPLIEADPMAGAPPAPILSDTAWLQLQAICGN